MSDRDLMLKAVEIADGCTRDDPAQTPKVGAVVAVGGTEVASGARGVDNHAEKNALAEADERGVQLDQATVYTTLEPCTFHARSEELDSCTDRLVAARVKKVFVGLVDPNQDICGRGISRLQESKIDVELFPQDLSNRIVQMNAEFVRAQRMLRVDIREPQAGSRLRGHRHTFVCRCTTAPGGDVYAMTCVAGVWWPQPAGFRPGGNRGEWAIDVTFGKSGEHSVHIVRADPIGAHLVAYYRRIAVLIEEQSRRFDATWLTRRHKSLLTGGYPGFEMARLPKGLKSLAAVQIEVEL
jgi:pyrimidine deaminase RibD-like protein